MIQLINELIQLNELKPILPLFSLAGKKAFVTGAAGGIGRSTAAALAELGADVALVDILLDVALENAECIANKYGVRTIAIKCDVSDPDSVKGMLSKIVAEFGTIDVVHSNAGIMAKGDGGTLSAEDWQRLVNINLNSMFYVNQAVALYLREEKKKGAVVNTASMSAHIVNTYRFRHPVCYATTKAGVLHLTKSMAMEFVRDGIRFNSISPGYIYSGIHDGFSQKFMDQMNASIPMERFGSLQEIGGIVAFLLSDLASYITGTDVVIDGGFCCW